MASLTERLVVYGSSDATPRTVLGSASIGADRAGQKLLCIDLSALPRDGKLELPIRDVLVLAGDPVLGGKGVRGPAPRRQARTSYPRRPRPCR